MTIIEAALEKSKAARSARPDAQPGLHQPHAPARRHDSPAPPAAPPSTRIEPRRVTFDPQRAREHRLLLSSSVASDRGIVAAYGMLRTRLLHRARAKGWQSIGVTSAAPQDGKSTTAINLALSLAREKNSSVVLLDLDMRNPSVCHVLGIDPPVELREYFENRADLTDELFMSIGIDHLLIAGNLTSTPHSAELLASNRLDGLLQYIRGATVNPLIIIDLPPALSPEDTLVVAPRIDALILVASEGVTPRENLQKAGNLLAEFPIAGLVVNRSSDTSQAYAYGYGGERGG
jgi:protein-tyrosine kinase